MPERLSLWNDTPTRQAILNFVAAITTPGGSDFIPPAERIATFDNDGTLWLEKPLYIQLQHGLHAIARMAAEKPELRDRQPFKAAYEKDMAWLGKVAADFARGDREVQVVNPHGAVLINLAEMADFEHGAFCLICGIS